MRLTLLFASEPHDGASQTRLCPVLTPEEASALVAAMLADALASHSGRPEYEAEVWTDPDSTTRLAQTLDDALARARTVVAIAASAPLVTPGLVAEAHARLESREDLVIAPDQGGAVALLGVSRRLPELSARAPLSDCARTLELARGAGLRVALLPRQVGVDRPCDLPRLRSALRAAEGDVAPRTKDVLAHIA